jgi:hypothetical protein
VSRSEGGSHEQGPAEAIVQSDDSPDDESAPAPLDGYRRYDPGEEMGEWFRSDFFDIAAVLWPVAFLILMGVSYASAQIGRLPIIFVLGVVAMAIHEGLHVLAGWLFGLEVTAGINFKRLNPYVLTYGGFQSRLQTAVISMAPLVVISAFCVVVLFALALLDRPLIDVAIFGLINIVLSYYDLLDLRFTMSLPEGTKEYHRREHDVAYYVLEAIDVPESGD